MKPIKIIFLITCVWSFLLFLVIWVFFADFPFLSCFPTNCMERVRQITLKYFDSIINTMDSSKIGARKNIPRVTVVMMTSSVNLYKAIVTISFLQEGSAPSKHLRTEPCQAQWYQPPKAHTLASSLWDLHGFHEFARI